MNLGRFAAVAQSAANARRAHRALDDADAVALGGADHRAGGNREGMLLECVLARSGDEGAMVRMLSNPDLASARREPIRAPFGGRLPSGNVAIVRVGARARGAFLPRLGAAWMLAMVLAAFDGKRNDSIARSEEPVRETSVDVVFEMPALARQPPSDVAGAVVDLLETAVVMDLEHDQELRAFAYRDPVALRRLDLDRSSVLRFRVVDGMGRFEELKAVLLGGDDLADAAHHVAVGREMPPWVHLLELARDSVYLADLLGYVGHGFPFLPIARNVLAHCSRSHSDY